MGVLTFTGALTEIYDKNLLVPFGESLPFPTLAQHIMRTLAFNRGTYWPGTTPATMTIGNLQALPLICYEANFTNFVQRNLQDQTLLLNITNDNWFDGTTAPHQHAAMARLRAVETGLPLIRVANTGKTMVTDGYGRILSSLPLRQAAILDTQIPRPAALPLYRRLFAALWP